VHASLTEGFTHLLHRWRARCHLERLPLLDALTATKPEPPHGGALAQGLLAAAAAAAEPADLLVRLDARADGLDAIEAASRLSRDGPNEITREKPLPGWLHLRRCNLNEPVRSAVDRAGGAVVPERRREGRRDDRRDGRPEHDHPVRAGRPFAPCGTGPVGAGGQHCVGHPPRPAGAPARSPAAFMLGGVRKGAFAPCSLPAHGAC
jgi:hypothetical protein